MSPLLQSGITETIQPYLDQVKSLLQTVLGKAQYYDLGTTLGVAAGLVVMVVALKTLKKIIGGGSSGGGADRAGIRRDAKKLKRQGDYGRAGELFELAGDLDEAVKMYKEGQAYSSLGALYERQKKWNQAATAFESARDHERSAQMFQKAGNYAKAAEVLMAGNKSMMAAELFEKAKNFGEAARLYEKSGYLQKAGACYERSQDYAKAADLMEKHYLHEKVRQTGSQGSKEQKRALDAMAQQSGRLYLKAGAPDKAAKIFAMGGFPGDAAEAYVAIKDFQKAAELFYEGKLLQKAADMYKQIGNLKKMHTTLAEIYLDERNYLEAARMYEKAEDFLQAGDLYERAGQIRKAGEMLVKGGDNTRAAEIFQHSGDPLLAAQALEAHKRPKDAAKLYLQAGAFESAARVLEESGDFYEAGMIFHKLGRLEDTVAFLQKVDIQSENYYAASLLLGKIFMDRGMLDAARERYKKLISKKEISPDTIEPYYNLAQIYEKNLEYENALLLYDKVLAENYNYKDVQKRIEAVKEGARREKAAAASRKTDASRKGRYKLVEKVGQGGMGVVYRAEDTILNRIVAYKVLPPSVRDNPKVLENFLQEARVAAAINHPNIVTVFDTGAEGVEPYIIMEFVDGISLKEMLEKRSPIPVPELIGLGLQICEGLEYAHAKNVIHRDIKPANIMLNKENRVKIMDFGLAKILSSSALEGTGVQGTPLYMSPEQIEGKRVDQRSDIYSLGCTLYRMSTGRPPFTEGDIYSHHLHTPPAPPRSLNPAIPEALDRLILKCLAKKADERYQRASEILAELKTMG